MTKYLHVTCVAISVTLFVLRAGLQFAGVPWRRYQWLRVMPHAVDTVLLGSAIWLTVLIGQYPLVQAWLTAKLLAVIGYILLGRMALKQDTGVRRRAVGFGGALLCVAYIVGVAVTHSSTLGV